MKSVVRTKIFEWIGFIIVLVSLFANAYIRADGITKGTEINLTKIGMTMGAILTCTFFVFRKVGNKGVHHNSGN